MVILQDSDESNLSPFCKDGEKLQKGGKEGLTILERGKREVTKNLKKEMSTSLASAIKI